MRLDPFVCSEPMASPMAFLYDGAGGAAICDRKDSGSSRMVGEEEADGRLRPRSPSGED